MDEDWFEHLSDFPTTGDMPPDAPSSPVMGANHQSAALICSSSPHGTAGIGGNEAQGVISCRNTGPAMCTEGFGKVCRASIFVIWVVLAYLMFLFPGRISKIGLKAYFLQKCDRRICSVQRFS